MSQILRLGPLIEAGNLVVSEADRKIITEDHFPFLGNPSSLDRLKAIWYDQWILNSDIRLDVERRGLKFANLWEELIYLVAHPNEPLDNEELVAPGSIWIDPIFGDNLPVSPMCKRDASGRRELTTFWFLPGNGCNSGRKILVVTPDDK